MSASREKKARQELNESGYVDPRKAREAKEKAKERRSTRIYTAVIVAFVLLGVVLFASGRIQASNEAKETARIGAESAVTIDGEDFSVNDVAYYYGSIYNPFANNIAQAVELVDVLDRCSALCRRLAADEFEGSSEPVPFEVRAGRGVGFTEAPRGALFHILDINGDGRIERASIMTPTAQNIANLEADMRQLAEKMVAGGYDADLITLEVEKLVRAYDPCLSCSVH